MNSLFTIPNAVLVALVQIAVIVAGAGGAMMVQRLFAGAALPLLTMLFSEGGVFLLVIPLLWITAAMLIRRHPDASDDLKNIAFASGVLIVVALALLGAAAVIHPLLHGDWQVGGGPESESPP